MDTESLRDLEDRLAAEVEQLDDAIAAGDNATAVDSPRLSPAELSTLVAAHESLLRLQRVWPRGGSRRDLDPAMGAGCDPASEPRSTADFGRFRVVRELGRGSFGVVFLATDPELNRPVALKLPRAECLLDTGARERFLREAKAVAALDHPGIVPLYEAGEVHGVCYMASAYCQGPDLAEWLREQVGPVDPRTAARLVADMARAIQHAHDRGVLHRDLKPSNILLHRRPPKMDGTGANGPPGDDEARDSILGLSILAWRG